jgi:tol-pal system protein YbgF
MKMILTFTAAAVVLVSSRAEAQSRVEMQMAAELRMLQTQTQELALALTRIDEALKAINGRIAQADQETKRGFADQAFVIKSLTTELSTIREGTQDTNTRLNQLRDEVEALRSSVATLPQLLAPVAAPPPGDPAADPNATPSAGALPPQGGAPPPPVTQTPPAAASTFGLSPARMYNQALADYQAGQYTVAISGFESFIRQFPGSDLADDAYVYMGEAHFLQNNLEQAIAAYSQAIQNYPRGDALSTAYYKRGVAQANLQQVDAARASLEAVIKLYPNSRDAILARQRLDGLRQQPAPASKP